MSGTEEEMPTNIVDIHAPRPPRPQLTLPITMFQQSSLPRGYSLFDQQGMRYQEDLPPLRVSGERTRERKGRKIIPFPMK